MNDKIECPYCNSPMTLECTDGEWFCEKCERYFTATKECD